MDKRLPKPEKKTQAPKETRQKGFNELQYNRESNSSTKDLKIKPGDDLASKSGDRKLQVSQYLWQRADGQGASNPGERPSKAVQYWRPKSGDQGVSNPGEKPSNAGKGVPPLKGGRTWYAFSTGGTEINNHGAGNVYHKSHHINDESSEQQKKKPAEQKPAEKK